MGARPSSKRLRVAAGGCLLALGLAACGSAHANRETAAAPAKTKTGAGAAQSEALSPAECATTYASTLGQVAARIYQAAGHGVVAGEAVHRVQNSASLAQAIRKSDASAATKTLKSLLVGQIVRAEIVQAGGHVLASAGTGAAIAPVSGSIPGTNARYVLSTQADQSYLQVTRQVTGAEVLLLSGGRRLAGTTAGPAPAGLSGGAPIALSYADRGYEALVLPATAYPSGTLQIALLVPSDAIACHGPAAQARVEALGAVGERIYREERESPYTKSVLRRVEASAALRGAAARQDVSGTRTAIVGFFAAHIHVVRVRVTVPTAAGDERLLYDLGGPHVLAPVKGTLRSGGRVAGHFEMAIQDDAGYLKLARLFTGAQVLMRTARGQVEGSLKPGPARVPDRGAVGYAGRTYQAYSFTGEAFPSGPLRISLLIG